jgi:hypothetical protein
VVRKVVRQGGKSASFAEAGEDLGELAGIAISPKQVERLTERVGGEWATRRDADVAAFRAGRLARDYARQAPAVSAVMLDGGRTQTRADDRPPGVHEPAWRETKVACCLTLASTASDTDPQPEPPGKFLDPERVAKLVRQIKARGAGGGEGDKDKQAKTEKAKARKTDGQAAGAGREGRRPKPKPKRKPRVKRLVSRE